MQIPRSTTDQLCQGNEVVLARTSSETCPVAMPEAHIQRGDIQMDSNPVC